MILITGHAGDKPMKSVEQLAGEVGASYERWDS